MDPSAVTDLCRDALMTALVIVAPVLLVGIAAGLLIGFLQALTQIQDQTVSTILKIFAMAGVLVACIPWIMGRMVEFTQMVFENAATM